LDLIKILPEPNPKAKLQVLRPNVNNLSYLAAGI